MENRTLSLKKNEYDPFIDYIKGFCILSVIILHSTPVSVLKASLGCLWISMCVSLFLLVQVFHAYKKHLILLILIWLKLGIGLLSHLY